MLKTKVKQVLQTIPILNEELTAIRAYAEELLDEYAEDEMPVNEKLLHKALLNGAENWIQYSFGGCSLCYNSDIIERLQLPEDTDSNTVFFEQAKALAGAEYFIKKVVFG